MLNDVLMSGLKIVFCGSAAGSVSAARGEYYAGPGNKFYPVLFEIGLTPRSLTPNEFMDLPKYGIGLTDVVKDQAGSDASINFRLSNPKILGKKIQLMREGQIFQAVNVHIDPIHQQCGHRSADKLISRNTLL